MSVTRIPPYRQCMHVQLIIHGRREFFAGLLLIYAESAIRTWLNCCWVCIIYQATEQSQQTSMGKRKACSAQKHKRVTKCRLKDKVKQATKNVKVE